MPLQPPDPAAIRRFGEHYGLGLSDADVESFSPFVHGLLTSWDAVEPAAAGGTGTTPPCSASHTPSSRRSGASRRRSR